MSPRPKNSPQRPTHRSSIEKMIKLGVQAYTSPKSTAFIGAERAPYFRGLWASELVSQLVGALSPVSQPQRITSGLNTNFTLSPRYSFQKSCYHRSCLLEPIYILWALNTGTCIQQGDLFDYTDLHRKQKSGEV